MCSTRRIIENVFGILAAKWRVLLKPLETSDQVADSIVLATCVLHNFLIDESTLTNPLQMVDSEGQEDGQWRQVVPSAFTQQSHARRGRVNAEASAVRDALVTYFSGYGAIDARNHE